MSTRKWSLVALAVAMPALLAAGGFAVFAAAGDVHEAPHAGTLATATSTVTMADLEAAQAQVRACLAGAGYDVVVILPGDGLRPTQYTFLGNITDQAGIEAANAAQAACRAEYSDAITEEWGKQQSPPTTAQLEDLHGRLLACVANGGNASLMDALSGHGTPRGLSAFVGFSPATNSPTRPMNISPDQMLAYSGCALELKAETGLDAPMPSPDYLEKLRGSNSP